jgi:hypothetical protein
VSSLKANQKILPTVEPYVQATIHSTVMNKKPNEMEVHNKKIHASAVKV